MTTKCANDNSLKAKQEFNRARTEMFLLSHRVFNLTGKTFLKGLEIEKLNLRQIQNYMWYLRFELEFYKKELGTALKI